MQVFALWNGGSSYRPSSIHDNDLEVFDSIAAAGQALSDRARLGHHYPQTFRYADGREVSALTPNADEGASMDLFFADPREATDAIPDRRLVLTRNGNAVPNR